VTLIWDAATDKPGLADAFVKRGAGRAAGKQTILTLGLPDLGGDFRRAPPPQRRRRK